MTEAEAAEVEDEWAGDETSIEEELERRYMKNVETAKRIGMEFFGGAHIHGWEPDWSFWYPKYIHKGDTFRVADWAMGFIAERLNLPWIWGYYDQELPHPMQMVNDHIERQEKKEKYNELMLHKASQMWLHEKKERFEERPRCFFCAERLGEDARCPTCGRAHGEWAHFADDPTTPITVYGTGGKKLHLYENCSTLIQYVKKGKGWHYIPGLVHKANICRRCLKSWENEHAAT